MAICDKSFGILISWHLLHLPAGGLISRSEILECGVLRCAETLKKYGLFINQNSSLSTVTSIQGNYFLKYSSIFIENCDEFYI